MLKNYKNAKIRAAILDLLAIHRRPLTAKEILSEVKQKFSKVNKTTVYRGLEILASENLVKTASFGDRNKRYEISALPHHHHLICTSCSKVEDIFLKNDLAKVEKKIQAEKQFKHINHSLEFFGLCQNCN